MFARKQAFEDRPIVVVEKRSIMRTAMMAGAAGAALEYFLDPAMGRSRRAQTSDRLAGLARRTERRAERKGRAVQARAHGWRERVLHFREQPKDFDDATLQRKVESEVFGERWFPKGSINANVVDGVVELRGEVDEATMRRIEHRVGRVKGVNAVNNLMHSPGRPAPNKAAAMEANAGGEARSF